MNDVERHQLICDLMVLSDTLQSAISTAKGDQLNQLLELANESEAALRELQRARPAMLGSGAQYQAVLHG